MVAVRVEAEIIAHSVRCKVSLDTLQQHNRNQRIASQLGMEVPTLASMIVSFPPKKNIVFLGSLGLGISSYHKEFEDQSKCL